MDPEVKVVCKREPWREKTFYFRIDENGVPIPNYCEDMSGSAKCAECEVDAKKKMEKKIEDYVSQSDPIPI